MAPLSVTTNAMVTVFYAIADWVGRRRFFLFRSLAV